jgi:tetratricopeptide (TPR) repeat protein
VRASSVRRAAWGLVIVLAACGSNPTTEPASSAPSVAAEALSNELSRAEAAYKRGVEASTGWRFAEAARELEIAFRIYDKSLPETDKRLQNTLSELGRATRGISDFERSKLMLRRRLTIARTAGDRVAEGIALNQLGLTAHESRDLAEAKRLYEASIAIDEELGIADDDDEKTAHLNNLGLVLSNLGEHERGAEILERVLAADRAEDPESVNTANTMHNLAPIYRDAGDYEKAKQTYQGAIKILTAKLGSKHPRLAPSLQSLGNTFFLLREYVDATRLYKQVLAIPELDIEPRVNAHLSLATVEIETHRAKKAIATLDETIALLEDHFDPAKGHVLIVRALTRRVEAHIAAGNAKLAGRDSDAAVAMSMKIHAEKPDLAADAIDAVAGLWEGVPREAKRAMALRARARDVRSGT